MIKILILKSFNVFVSLQSMYWSIIQLNKNIPEVFTPKESPELVFITVNISINLYLIQSMIAVSNVYYDVLTQWFTPSTLLKVFLLISFSKLMSNLSPPNNTTSFFCFRNFSY